MIWLLIKCPKSMEFLRKEKTCTLLKSIIYRFETITKKRNRKSEARLWEIVVLTAADVAEMHVCVRPCWAGRRSKPDVSSLLSELHTVLLGEQGSGPPQTRDGHADVRTVVLVGFRQQPRAERADLRWRRGGRRDPVQRIPGLLRSAYNTYTVRYYYTNRSRNGRRTFSRFVTRCWSETGSWSKTH